MIVNPLTFFWKEGMSLAYPQHRVAADIARYRTNAFSLASWGKLMSGQVDLRQLGQACCGSTCAPRSRNRVRAAARAAGRPFPEDLPTELKQAAAAGIGLQFVFSDGDPGLELLRQGGGRSVRRMRTREALSIAVIPGADHTFTDLDARARLIDVVTRSMQAPARQKAPAPAVQSPAVTPYS